jgi:hypothetical protein
MGAWDLKLELQCLPQPCLPDWDSSEGHPRQLFVNATGKPIEQEWRLVAWPVVDAGNNDFFAGPLQGIEQSVPRGEITSDLKALQVACFVDVFRNVNYLSMV